MRNRSLPFASGRYDRASGECCKSGHFWRFQTLGNLISCGRHGTLWHSNTFHQVSKVVMCDRHNTFGSFSEDELHFSWQAQHGFGDLHPHFAWQARHFRRVVLRVVLRVFCESHFQRCVKCLQIPWQASHFVTCVEN